MNTFYKKTIIVMFAMFMIFIAFLLFSFLTDDSNEKFMQELSLHQKIDEQQIESTRMSKVVLVNSTYKHIDIDLSKEQIQRIITIFNSISPKSINSIDAINSSISSGIVIRLKNRSEVRIHYDKRNIYVSRPELKYIIEDIELKKIFDNELMNNKDN
jgi:hypothetical protein